MKEDELSVQTPAPRNLIRAAFTTPSFRGRAKKILPPQKSSDGKSIPQPKPKKRVLMRLCIIAYVVFLAIRHTKLMTLNLSVSSFHRAFVSNASLHLHLDSLFSQIGPLYLKRGSDDVDLIDVVLCTVIVFTIANSISVYTTSIVTPVFVALLFILDPVNLSLFTNDKAFAVSMAFTIISMHLALKLAIISSFSWHWVFLAIPSYALALLCFCVRPEYLTFVIPFMIRVFTTGQPRRGGFLSFLSGTFFVALFVFMGIILAVIIFFILGLPSVTFVLSSPELILAELFTRPHNLIFFALPIVSYILNPLSNVPFETVALNTILFATTLISPIAGDTNDILVKTILFKLSSVVFFGFTISDLRLPILSPLLAVFVLFLGVLFFPLRVKF